MRNNGQLIRRYLHTTSWRQRQFIGADVRRGKENIEKNKKSKKRKN